MAGHLLKDDRLSEASSAEPAAERSEVLREGPAVGLVPSRPSAASVPARPNEVPDTTLLSVREIRTLIAGAPPEPGGPLWARLAADPRKGVADLLASLVRRRARSASASGRLAHMRRFEAELWAAGVEHVAGVDEAGRGPLAGPVVAAAVVLPRELRIEGINDSKQLTPARREELYGLILADAVGVGVGSASEKVVDEINILAATFQAMRDAVAALAGVPDHVLVDGNPIRGLDIPQTALPRGDERSTVIAAASIVAKVTRDRLLVEYDAVYPGYGFARHKGYGTAEHVAALARLGPCEIHRLSFGLVREVAGGDSELYRRSRALLLRAETRDELERVAGTIAREKEKLVPYELARLRGLYRRCYARANARTPVRR
jgi:ribonuclease HII